MFLTTPKALTALRSRPRAAVIFVALILIGIMAISVVAMLRYTGYQHRLSARRVEREAVYYTAEAGVDQVMHYLRFPSDWVADANFFKSDESGDAQTYQDLIDRMVLAGGTKTLVDSSTNTNLIVMDSEVGSGTERARVTELTITLPTSPEADGEFLIVESHAVNANGVERIVRANFNADPGLALIIPAAIISHASGVSGGQANVHWGEGWFKDTFTLPNGGVNNLTTATDDPWAVFRVVNEVYMSNGNYADGTTNGTTTALTSVETNYEQPWYGDPDHENIFQHVDPDTLVWPELDYNTWKQIAQTRGHFFSTDAAGNLYYGSEKTAENRITSSQFYNIIDQTADLTVNAGVEGDQTLPPADIIFIDTIDGNPPAADGSNLCDISLSGGGGIFTHGVMYVGGDYRVGGAGSPPALWMADPDEHQFGTGDWELENVRHKGLIFAEGVYEQQGNQITYGSIIAKDGFGSGGTPNVWYDYSLKGGLPFNSTPSVTVSFWEEVDPNVGG